MCGIQNHVSDVSWGKYFVDFSHQIVTLSKCFEFGGV